MEAEAPVEEGETLLRRVPLKSGHCDPSKPLEKCVSPYAFKPHKTQDQDGFSCSRLKHTQPSDLARSVAVGKEFYVVEFPAARVIKGGASIKPDPEELDVGHCLVPEMNSATRDGDLVALLSVELARSVTRIHGPFKGLKPIPPGP